MPDDERLAGLRARIATITDPDPTPAELALVLRLLQSFAAKTPAAVDTLLGGFGDLGLLRDRAHAVKGSAANIGATALAALCADLEDQARAGRVPDPATTANQIRTEATHTLAAISFLIAEYSSSYR